MGNTTVWVRQALQQLGADAPVAAVKAYIREKAPCVPEGQIGLALKKVRGSVVPRRKNDTTSPLEDDG